MYRQTQNLEEKINMLISRVNVLEEKVDLMLSILSPMGEKNGKGLVYFVAGATTSLIGILYLTHKVVAFVRMIVKGG